MTVGDKLCLVPTIETSSWINERNGPLPCRVIAVNKRHHHFTVEFDLPGGRIRETFKEVLSE